MKFSRPALVRSYGKPAPAIVPEEFGGGDGGGGGEEELPSLLCDYTGCGNPWSVQGPRGTKCSKHYWEIDTYHPPRSMLNWKGPDYGDDPLRFAKRLRDAHAAGWNISKLQLDYYKTALRIE